MDQAGLLMNVDASSDARTEFGKTRDAFVTSRCDISHHSKISSLRLLPVILIHGLILLGLVIFYFISI